MAIFLKSVFWHVLIILKVSEPSRTVGCASFFKNAVVRKMARIGFRRARMVFKKKQMGQNVIPCTLVALDCIFRPR